jgi:hypothetical protein
VRCERAASDLSRRRARLFTSEQAVTMEALVERLLPSNVPAGTPGAKETRVLRYSTGSRHAALPAVSRRHPRWARRPRRHRARQSSVRFHELPAGEQDEILRRVQRGDTQERPPASVRFFQVVLTLTLEGHCGSPRYGGNHDQLAWRSVGIDPGCEGGMRACR